jgi:hypothetical protein
MTEELKPSDSVETSSAATPEKKDSTPAEKSSPATSDITSHIVDATEKYLGQAFIHHGSAGAQEVAKIALSASLSNSQKLP